MAGENYLFEFMEMLLLALEAERVELRQQTSHVQDPPFPGHAAGRLLLHLHVLSLVCQGELSADIAASTPVSAKGSALLRA